VTSSDGMAFDATNKFVIRWHARQESKEEKRTRSILVGIWSREKRTAKARERRSGSLKDPWNMHLLKNKIMLLVLSWRSGEEVMLKFTA
jgi:hypothetical protein